MIKTPFKRKKRKKNQKASNDGYISWEELRNKIVYRGLYPFLDEVDRLFLPPPKYYPMPQQQCIVSASMIFTICIQPEPYNYCSQLYELQGEMLKKYYIKKMKSQSNIFQTNKQCLIQWSRLYKQCMFAIDGMTVMFMYLDRFYVPSNDGLDNIHRKGLKLFFKHIFTIKFPLIKDKLIEQINVCRDDFIQNNYFYVDYIWLITDCIQHLRSFSKHKYQRCYELDRDPLKLELLVFGYVRILENNGLNLNIPTQIIKIFMLYRGTIEKDLFDDYFYHFFVSSSCIYYRIKRIQWIHDSNITKEQYCIQCKRVIQYEMEQLTNWSVQSIKKLDFKETLCKILYRETTKCVMDKLL